MLPLAPDTLQSRSMGVKLITVGILALIMTVPAWFVDRLVEDRSRCAAEVSASIGSQLGGPQTFLGPVLAVPYTIAGSPGIYIVFPASGTADIVTKSEVRQRSLFRVPALWPMPPLQPPGQPEAWSFRHYSIISR